MERVASRPATAPLSSLRLSSLSLRRRRFSYSRIIIAVVLLLFPATVVRSFVGAFTATKPALQRHHHHNQQQQQQWLQQWTQSTSFLCRPLPSTVSARETAQRRKTSSTLCLSMSLKPAAIPLMDAGKAMAVAGESIIDWTSAIDIFGGGLSAAGAQVRNAGESLAQAAAHCRFKTGNEVVSDELRESATCLAEAGNKLQLAVQEAGVDELHSLASSIEDSIPAVRAVGTALESAGAAVLRRRAASEVGTYVAAAGQELANLSVDTWSTTTAGDDTTTAAGGGAADEKEFCQKAQERLAFASRNMILAGNALQTTNDGKRNNNNNAVGKRWIKGA